MTATPYATAAMAMDTPRMLPIINGAPIGGLARSVRWNDVLGQITAKRVLMAAIAMCVILFGIGWAFRADPSKKPYLEILGGGFIFDYREAEVYYGFAAQVTKPLGTGSIVEAQFQDPGGGPPLVVSQRVNASTDRYAFASPFVRGVVADKPYHVVIRVYDRQHKFLWSTTHDFVSQVSDTVVPKKPLVIGPGYTPNPDK